MAKQKPLLKKLVDVIFPALIIIIISFFLNLLWEVSHSMLYNWNAFPLQNNIYFFIPKILLATLGNILYIGLIITIISIYKKDLAWLVYPKKFNYIAVMILGIIFAVFIELKAKLLNSWSYNNLMPTIFSIGLTPLIQLAITSALSLFITSKYLQKNQKGGEKNG